MDPQQRALSARQQLESAAVIAMTHLALLLEAKDAHPVCAGAAVLQPHRCLPYTQMQAQSESGCAKPSQHWPNRMLSWTSLQRSSLQLVSLCDATALSELRGALLGGHACLYLCCLCPCCHPDTSLWALLCRAIFNAILSITHSRAARSLTAFKWRQQASY